MANKSRKSADLFDAVIKNDLALVRGLIAQGVKLDARNDDGTTALYEAVMSSYEEIALVLIEAGANINAKDRRGTSILMEAIKRKQKRVIQQLLSRGVDIHARPLGWGGGALEEASVFGPSELIRDLVALGSEIEENDYRCLRRAVGFKNVEAIQTLLELGANPNASILSNGDTLLVTAVKQKCEPAVKLLLEHGADVNTVNNEGLNALELAKEMKLKKIIQILIPYCARND